MFCAYRFTYSQKSMISSSRNPLIFKATMNQILYSKLRKSLNLLALTKKFRFSNLSLYNMKKMHVMEPTMKNNLFILPCVYYGAHVVTRRPTLKCYEPYSNTWRFRVELKSIPFDRVFNCGSRALLLSYFRSPLFLKYFTFIFNYLFVGT